MMLFNQRNPVDCFVDTSQFLGDSKMRMINEVICDFDDRVSVRVRVECLLTAFRSIQRVIYQRLKFHALFEEVARRS